MPHQFEATSNATYIGSLGDEQVHQIVKRLPSIRSHEIICTEEPFIGKVAAEGGADHGEVSIRKRRSGSVQGEEAHDNGPVRHVVSLTGNR